uniref:Molybdopterin synthase catalytic subunit n=1 Tax=Caenorhabditis japonica TaxID=281687 RepID=A0A8R1E1C5_CAEJA
MITEMDEILELCDRVIVLTLDVNTCRQRREARTDYVPPDTPGYFEHVAFPAYLRHLNRALIRSRTDARFTFIDVSEPRYSDRNESIIDYRTQILNDHIKITDTRLDLETIMKLAADSSCGAISTFCGVTRDNHDGRGVASLSYDAHDLMAYKKLRKICARIREQHPDIRKIVIFHRVGEVKVGESSVIICTSSPHRKSAIHATEMCIDLLKEEVPIFKYEEYTDGEEKGKWKSNEEDKKEKNVAEQLNL